MLTYLISTVARHGQVITETEVPGPAPNVICDGQHRSRGRMPLATGTPPPFPAPRPRAPVRWGEAGNGGSPR